ncbi:MAG: MATE family efflux transporter [Lachnospiraceae bacterium]|nr:MATE family efflux transporter [Lachnospiraceae bacterium]
MKSSGMDFTQGNVGRQLLVFSAPLFLSNLLQIVYNMVDMIIVGHVTGKAGLSAVSVGGDVSNFLTFLAMGFTSAGQVIISQYVGAGKKKEISRFISTMFDFLMICAMTLSVVCLLLREPILAVMNTPAESYDQTMSYATVCMIGLVFIYGYNIVGAVLRGLGDSNHPFVFISIAAVMNVILDLIFVIPLQMGAMGAALATVISQAVSFIVSVVFLFRSQEKLGLELKAEDFRRIDRSMLADLVKLGIPMAIKSASVQFSKLFVNSWINSYGVAVSAMAGIANKISSISNLFSNAINTAGSSMVGQNIGAEKYERVPRIMATAFGITLGIAAAMSALILLFPEPIFRIFTSEADVLEIAMRYVPIAILLFAGSACRAAMNSLINGSGNYKINFATAIMDGIVMRIGLSVLFGLGLGMEYLGFWLGDALAGFTPFWIGAIFYFTGRWKTNRYLIRKK